MLLRRDYTGVALLRCDHAGAVLLQRNHAGVVLLRRDHAGERTVKPRQLYPLISAIPPPLGTD